MMLERDEIGFDMFGLAGTFPRPGWVVLDAARTHGFTGELTFETIPSVKCYLDDGSIYLAERVTDPSLGSRLVDAGALNAAQLEHGSMLVGEVAHLGRLFERVPSVNRHTVMVMTEMMTEECVGWLAGQLVRDVVAAPYRHHPAGVQRWLQRAVAPNLVPGEPLPSPAVDEAPTELVPPESLFAGDRSFDDGLIKWDQPSWLDERLPVPPIINLLSDDTPRTDADVDAVETLDDPTAQAPPASPVFDAPRVGLSVAQSEADSPAPPTPFTRAREIVAASAATEADVDAPEAADPTSFVTDSANWEDLVTAVVESDSPDTDPVTPETDPHHVRDGLSWATRASSGESSEPAASSPPSPEPPEPPEPFPGPSPVVESTLAPAATRSGSIAPQTDRAPEPVFNDWVDHLDTDGLPEPGSEMLLSTKRLPPTRTVVDRFELIWPSGEIDDQFGSPDTASIADLQPDLDRPGLTARLATTAGGARGASAATLEHDDRQPVSVPIADLSTNGHDEVTDEVVLAVRRAVASIETSSLAARRRLVTSDPDDDPSRGISDRGIRSLRPVSATSDALTPIAHSARRVPTRSVFDDDISDATSNPDPSLKADAPVVEPQDERVGALRRLIGSLRLR